MTVDENRRQLAYVLLAEVKLAVIDSVAIHGYCQTELNRAVSNTVNNWHSRYNDTRIKAASVSLNFKLGGRLICITPNKEFAQLLQGTAH